ncbi:MAG: hypothetical protein EBS54_03890 [Betaproteobacteria bacterium]|nr:hypothetical protein [Betaproteobacteria bacterium]NBQ79700.1 hypothetical protein [Betaproteobacteria bacterium]NBQ96128.1 hypothetical protein [Betaproteobacteria bacterium]NBS22220.1 hypothetical protein [Betaproteobacteria bacterium]NBS40258.1 hypothetical protein [Betaproteobacteria bacterium]
MWLFLGKAKPVCLPVVEVCRKHGISNALYYQWMSKFGGLT